ncbi:hypothetical protein ACF0H5_004244 [Mactra antiquata]
MSVLDDILDDIPAMSILDGIPAMSILDDILAMSILDDIPAMSILDDILDDILAISILDDIPTMSILDDIPAKTILDDIPAMSILGDIPAMSVLDDIPAMSILDDIPAMSVLDDKPAMSILDDILAMSVLDDIPTMSILDDTPAMSILDDTPAMSILDDIPSKTILDDIPAMSILDDIPAMSILDGIPAMSVLDDILAMSILDDIPTMSILDDIPDIPAMSILDDILAMSILDDITAISILDDIPAMSILDDIPAMSILDDISAMSVLDDIPAMSILDVISAMSVLDDIPAMSILDDTPAMSILDDIPAKTILDDIPAMSILNDIPAMSVLDDIPAMSILDGISAMSVLDDIPAMTILDDIPAMSILDDILDDVPAMSIPATLGHCSTSIKYKKLKPPNITNLPSSFLLNEDTNTETRLLVLNYTDSDQPTSATTISLGAGSTPSDFADKFKIRQVNGTNNWAIFSKSGASFNASASDTYTLLIEANDTVDVTTETFTVYIKANTPPEINNLNASVSMHVDSPIGFVIFKVNAIDLENDSVTYSFNCTPTCDYFTFLSDGSVVLNQNIMNLTTTGFNFSVTPHDAKRSGATKLLAVHVAGINNLPIMVGLNSNVSIPEGTAIGSYIAEATCNDIDVPNTDTLKYFISCEPTWGSHFVTINDSDGVIRTLSTINYESIPVASGARTITCIATCFDGLASSSATLVANILDINEPPAFAQSSYTFNVNEGPANTTYFTSALTVTDDDPGDTVTFAHDCGAYTGLFRINSTDGRMSFGADVDVDTTAPQSITCLINATDSTGLFATATVTLIIANVNDNIPMIRSPVYSFTVLKQATVGTPVGTITATDGDIAPWGEISYTLDQTGTGCACFDVTSSGQLIVGQSLTGLKTSYVSFNVTVTDLGGNADTAKITVYLLEVATTTPLDRYLTFIDDTGNIAWLIPAVVIFAVAAGVIGFLVFTAKSTAHASTLKCQCCRLRRSFSPKRSKRPRQSRSRSPVAHTQYRHFPQIKPV